MRILNNLILRDVAVSAAQNSDEQELQHMWFGDITAQITVANPSDKTFTTTDVNITANTVTITAHGYLTGVKVTLTTDDTLPAGLSTSTDYYLIKLDDNTIKFATSQANASAGTAIDLTDTGAGTQTVVVTATIAGAIKLQKNNEPWAMNTTVPPVWVDITGTSQTFTTATVLNWALTDMGYQSLRAVVTLTSGTISGRIRVNAKGFGG